MKKIECIQLLQRGSNLSTRINLKIREAFPEFEEDEIIGVWVQVMFQRYNGNYKCGYFYDSEIIPKRILTIRKKTILNNAIMYRKELLNAKTR